MGDVWLDIGDIWWAILCCQISTQHHLPLAPSLFGYNPKTLTQQQQQISIYTRSSSSRASNILKIDIHLQRGKTKGRLLQDACSGEVSLCRSNVGRTSPQPGQPEILPTLIILMLGTLDLKEKFFHLGGFLQGDLSSHLMARHDGVWHNFQTSQFTMSQKKRNNGI